MKLSELKPCAVCGGKIAPLFYRITSEQILIDAGAANRTLGLFTMFGGRAMNLVETMGMDDSVVTVLQSNSMLLCPDCAYEMMGEKIFGADGGDE